MDDQRDYAEEAANRAAMIAEQEAEYRAECVEYADDREAIEDAWMDDLKPA